MAKKLKHRQDGWPDDKDPCELYLYIDPGTGLGEERIVISSSGVDADSLDMSFNTTAELEEWIAILRLAWQMKMEQDAKEWRPREE